jgi:hypothetical protein
MEMFYRCKLWERKYYMNKLVEFRRLRWIALIQDQLYQLRKNMIAAKLQQLNSEETALEYVNNELMRLAQLEQHLLKLSYDYDFLEDFTPQDVSEYINNFVGTQDLV